MASIGRLAIEALATRLRTLTLANGYDHDMKRVITDSSEMGINLPETDLPTVEIVNDITPYEHMASSSYWAEQHVILFIVAPKSWTDGQMEDLLADIKKCLYGGSASASGNTGITLDGAVQSIHLVQSAGDLNLIEANRTYVLKIILKTLRITYKG